MFLGLIFSQSALKLEMNMFGSRFQSRTELILSFDDRIPPLSTCKAHTTNKEVNIHTTTFQEKKPQETVSAKVSKWSNRFIFAAIVQGAIAAVLTIPIVWPWLSPSVAQVIASGSAGTWFLVGYVMYITVGVIAVGLTALFYHHFEVNLHKSFNGAVGNTLGWIHLVFMNVGAAVASAILMYGGYFGERALMPTSDGGLAQSAGWVHVNILSGLVDPAGYALIVCGIGVLAGGLGFLIAYLRK